LPLILMIDDDVTILSDLGLQLEDAGFEVARSSDLAHAEGMFAERRPDLVLLEVRSGRDAGWGLLERMAAATPVVVLSGAAHEEDVLRGFAAGAADYVSKPYRSAELIARVRARLAAAPPLTALASAPTAPHVGATERLAPPPEPPVRRGRPAADEAIFMSEAEEMALLRMPDARTPGASQRQLPAEGQSIGQRLRSERQSRHMTLVQVENELKIRISYLQALEDEKYTLLPRGPVALQMVRSYADFLGLAVEPIVEEFRSMHYAEQYSPLPALGGSRIPRSLPAWVIWLVAALLAVAVVAGAVFSFDPGFIQRLWAQIQPALPAVSP
jgi:CheY-like chemotaxis protein